VASASTRVGRENAVSEQSVHVCFLSQDLGFADPLARALGTEFTTRASSDVQFDRLTDLREWCDVVLLDLRSAHTTAGDSESRLRLMDEIIRTPTAPPVIALCDEGNSQIILRAIERGAYDTITNPPNMMELRLVLRRAHRSHVSEQEVERLKASARGSGRLHELLGTSSTMQ